jgi:hypothetical protein
MQKNETRPLSFSQQLQKATLKINSNINVSPETMTPTEENIEKMLQDTGLDKKLLEKTERSQETNTVTDKWNCIKLGRFCTGRKTGKRKSTEWEKIFAKYMCEKGFMSRIYKQLQKLSIQKIKHGQQT